jgi:hypothetical protein
MADLSSLLLIGRNVMSIKLVAHSAFAATLFGLAAMATPAHAYVEVGMLNCRSPGTTGYIVVSARTFNCVFMPSSGAAPQYYQGTVQRFGAQIGVTNDVALGWAVFAATSRVGAGALAGGYVGASAGATVGIGGNANALVGGLNNSFALQPVSLEGQTGLNVVATVTGFALQPAAPARKHRRHRH